MGTTAKFDSEVVMPAVKKIQENTETLAEKVTAFANVVQDTAAATNLPLVDQISRTMSQLTTILKTVEERAQEALDITKKYDADVDAVGQFADGEESLAESLSEFGVGSN